MKKISIIALVVLLISVVALSLVACGEKESPDEIIHNGAFYNGLSEQDKVDFDAKLNTIINHTDYTSLSNDDKLALLNRLVESEKLRKEVEEEQAEQETRKEEVKQKLENLTSNKQELEQRVQDLKDSGASDEEIKTAEEEQQKVEEQIKAAEQEKIYYETVDTVKDATSNIQIFKDQNPGTSIRKIYEIYKWGGTAYINVDIVQTETICGIEIMSTTNGFCRIDIQLEEDESYQKILDAISNSEFAAISRVCSNKNAEWHKEYFEQNKYSIDPSMQKGESKGYSFSVIESWENNGNSEYPEFIVKIQRGDNENLYIITYSSGRYSSNSIQKICPEFWAQAEIENNK